MFDTCSNGRLFSPYVETGKRFRIWRIIAEGRPTGFDFGLQKHFLLFHRDSLVSNLGNGFSRNDDDGLAVTENNVVGINRDTTASNRLVHIRCMTGDQVGRCGWTGAISREANLCDIGCVANPSVAAEKQFQEANRALDGI
ncbi:hypothetical protein AGR7B_Lc100016 [Agrobacterium deltaense RV3]|nr:hypothetical protein AGR7B_Lc100016 [Agrobacterium deltaense RV3]